jgi:hypothetical protein
MKVVYGTYIGATVSIVVFLFVKLTTLNFCRPDCGLFPFWIKFGFLNNMTKDAVVIPVPSYQKNQLENFQKFSVELKNYKSEMKKKVERIKKQSDIIMRNADMLSGIVPPNMDTNPGQAESGTGFSENSGRPNLDKPKTD